MEFELTTQIANVADVTANVLANLVPREPAHDARAADEEMKDEASFAEQASGSQQQENVIRNQSSLSTEQIDTITRKSNGKTIIYYTDSSSSQPEQMRPSL